MARCTILMTLLAVFATNTIRADIIEVEGVVKAFDPSERLLELSLRTKTVELEVSRKAKVSAEGKDIDLKEISEGQTVQVKYHDDLEIVTEIVIGSAAPTESADEVELLEVSELSPNGNPQYPWLSPDGLTVYWEEEGAIWTATRVDVDGLFEGKKRLFQGRHPTVSADGREMVLLVGGVLHSTTRSSSDAPFKRPRAIRELRDQPTVKNPCISEDGLSLYFNRKGSRTPTEFAVCTRRSSSSPWGRPKTLKVQHPQVKGHLVWLFVSNDGLHLFCTNQGADLPNGNLMVWTRKTTNESFRVFEYIEFPDIDPVFGRSPRYVESTGELFFTQPKPETKKWGVSVIKNFASTLE